MITCPQCERLEGYIDQVDAKGVHRLHPCEHGRDSGMQSVREIVQDSGFRIQDSVLQKILTPKDHDIAEIIARRRGAAQAVSIDEITRELMSRAEESELRAGFKPAPTQSMAKLWERSIKDSVRRLRRAGMKVGACRGSRDGKKAVGYYVISNAQELRATVRPMLRQAIDELRTIEALTGRGMYARELEGQQKLFEQELA